MANIFVPAALAIGIWGAAPAELPKRTVSIEVVARVAPSLGREVPRDATAAMLVVGATSPRLRDEDRVTLAPMIRVVNRPGLRSDQMALMVTLDRVEQGRELKDILDRKPVALIGWSSFVKPSPAGWNGCAGDLCFH